MGRHSLPVASCTLLWACGWLDPAPPALERVAEAPADAPNILLISIDTLRADALQPYGSARPTAPTLAAIAQEGVVFERSWSQAPSTSPTHASMFTGALPSEHGVMGTHDRLPQRWTTAAEHFYVHGYRTFAAASSVRFARGVQLDQGFEDYSVYAKGSQQKKTQAALDDALRYIADAPDQPWFGFVHLMDVHAPYRVPEPYQSRYLQGPPSVPPEKTVRFLHRNRNNKRGVSLQERLDLRAMYDGGVDFVDTRIAEIWDAVRALDRPTVVVITADHGEAFLENDYLGHGTFTYESIVRVPLIVWAPDRFPAGLRRSTLAQSIDLFPTFTSIAGIPTPEGLAGADLTAVARGETELTGRSVVVQSRKFYSLVKDEGLHLYKLDLAVGKARSELYDLSADPDQQTPLGAEHAERAEEMIAEVKAWGFRQRKEDREQWDLSEEEAEALKAIGYME